MLLLLCTGPVLAFDYQLEDLNGNRLSITVETETFPDGEIAGGVIEGGEYHVSPPPDAILEGLDFGNFKLFTISGLKFEDRNGDGQRQARDSASHTYRGTARQRPDEKRRRRIGAASRHQRGAVGADGTRGCRVRGERFRQCLRRDRWIEIPVGDAQRWRPVS